jgi:hypothetical protein
MEVYICAINKSSDFNEDLGLKGKDMSKVLMKCHSTVRGNLALYTVSAIISKMIFDKKCSIFTQMQDDPHIICMCHTKMYSSSGIPRNFFFFGRGSTNSVEDRGEREWGSGGGSPLVRGSGSSCNLVQETSFHTVKFS